MPNQHLNPGSRIENQTFIKIWMMMTCVAWNQWQLDFHNLEYYLHPDRNVKWRKARRTYHLSAISFSCFTLRTLSHTPRDSSQLAAIEKWGFFLRLTWSLKRELTESQWIWLQRPGRSHHSLRVWLHLSNPYQNKHSANKPSGRSKSTFLQEVLSAPSPHKTNDLPTLWRGLVFSGSGAA